MSLNPTMYLRFVERQELDTENSTHEYIAHRTTRVLQQFWAHPNGESVCGTVFGLTNGTWLDVPMERES